MEIEHILARELLKRGYDFKETWKFVNSLTNFVNSESKMTDVANAIILTVIYHK